MRIIETVDIHQIINEAMEKKDRYVNLSITCDGISLTINPIVEPEIHATDDTQVERPNNTTNNPAYIGTRVYDNHKYGSDLDAWREGK